MSTRKLANGLRHCSGSPTRHRSLCGLRLTAVALGLCLPLTMPVNGAADDGIENAYPLPGFIAIAPVLAEVGAVPTVAEVPRIGMNLGHWTYWGAEQLSRNVLKNPGLEGVIDRALVRVGAVGLGRFSDDQTWLARPDGFWAGAGFEVLTGAAAGARGLILDSLARGDAGLPEFLTDGVDPVLRHDLAVGDIVALTLVRDDLPPTNWWLPDLGAGQVQVDLAETAPGSPGVRSLALLPLPGKTLRLTSHLDSIGSRAGVLLPVAGPWRLALWLRGAPAGEDGSGEPPTVRLLFRRHGDAAFVDLTLRPEPGWQQVEHQFEATEGGSIRALEFAIEVRGSGPVHVDDVWLGPVAVAPASDVPDSDAPDTNAFAGSNAFRPEVLGVLQRLRPGYLRDWQNQLGDTLDNRLAEPFARRASRYRPGKGVEFGYGLPEFIALSRAVGANPWVILPTTFLPEEAEDLGAWLAAEAADFDEVLIEFGNENWNAIFRPAGIQDPTRHAAAADRLFAALQAGAGQQPNLRLVVNGQHANPWLSGKVATASQHADVLAVAPYFLAQLGVADQPQALDLLFADDGGRLAETLGRQPPGQGLAVYEVNLHTTRGDALATDRAAITTGAASGTALAQRLLVAMALGARQQCVYTLAGIDTPLDGQPGLVPLFGVTRDLTRTDRLRPTGWAVALLNRVIGGDLHPVQLSGPGADGLLVAPFLSATGWFVAVVSASPQARALTLRFPDDSQPRPIQAAVLSGAAPLLDNETTDQVRPQSLEVQIVPAPVSGGPMAAPTGVPASNPIGDPTGVAANAASPSLAARTPPGLARAAEARAKAHAKAQVDVAVDPAANVGARRGPPPQAAPIAGARVRAQDPADKGRDHSGKPEPTASGKSAGGPMGVDPDSDTDPDFDFDSAASSAEQVRVVIPPYSLVVLGPLAVMP